MNWRLAVPVLTGSLGLALAALYVASRPDGVSPGPADAKASTTAEPVDLAGPSAESAVGEGPAPIDSPAATEAEAPAAPPTAEGPPFDLEPALWQVAQADEQINIRVYEAANRGVVNITTSAGRGPRDDPEPTGSGSGFVLDKGGHVLTNFHVIDGADSVQVGLFDGSIVEAEFVGADPSNDLAVLKIDVPAEKLWPIEFGDSKGLKVGQKVLALGNPFGLERTLTTGIISSVDRSLEATNGRMIKGIVQTDAAINPGNSGGPLLNARGQVIGMNTAIFSRVGQSAGIGFAVPIANISRVLEPLIRDGRIVRADLGVRKLYAIEEGLLIIDLVKGGAAEIAGLRALEIKFVRRGGRVQPLANRNSADIITAVEGVPVRSIDELLTEIEANEPGTRVNLRVIRQGREVEIPVTLGSSS